MKKSSQNSIIIIAIIIVVVIVIIGLTTRGGEAPQVPEGQVGVPSETPAVAAPRGTQPSPQPQAPPVQAPVAPQASPVEKGQVIAPTGKPAKLNVEPGSPEAPQQSAPVSPQTLSPAAIKLEMSATGYKPSSFTVQAGQVVTLAVTSADEFTHVHKFDDPSLEAVALGLAPGETRAITFNAPAKKGEYKFHCDVPGHAGRGEVGVMIVR